MVRGCVLSLLLAAWMQLDGMLVSKSLSLQELAQSEQSSKQRVTVPGFTNKKKDAADQWRDKKRQNGAAKIETIVEEDLLDGDEENIVEEQLDVSWQPVS